VAKRIRQTNAPPAPAPPAKTHVIRIVVCQTCGDRFAISHDITAVDPELAARQAVWLAEHFVWDHIQENRHRGSITLPGARELKQLASSRA
jgi:hypothetical protein